MEFTVRIPKQVLITIGAVLSVAAGFAVARLLPTAYEGQISYGAGRPWEAVYAPTSTITYVIMGALALVLYLDAVATTGRIRPRRKRAARPVRQARPRVLSVAGAHASYRGI